MLLKSKIIIIDNQDKIEKNIVLMVKNTSFHLKIKKISL